MSALLSYGSAQRSLRNAAEGDAARRAHERAIRIWERQCDAVERIWVILFKIEQTQSVSEQLLDEIVRAVVWLPLDARTAALKLIVAMRREQDPDWLAELERVRAALLALTAPAAAPTGR